jgi:hypothetical protein
MHHSAAPKCRDRAGQPIIATRIDVRSPSQPPRCAERRRSAEHTRARFAGRACEEHPQLPRVDRSCRCAVASFRPECRAGNGTRCPASLACEERVARSCEVRRASRAAGARALRLGRWNRARLGAGVQLRADVTRSADQYGRRAASPPESLRTASPPVGRGSYPARTGSCGARPFVSGSA